MADRGDAPNGRRGLIFLLMAVILALGLSVLGSYLVVVSQNPASRVNGPSFVYGSPTP